MDHDGLKRFLSLRFLDRLGSFMVSAPDCRFDPGTGAYRAPYLRPPVSRTRFIMPDTVQPVYLQYRRNVHSQYGEDGIIEWLLGKLSLRVGFFVEFGAWDGLYLCNCRRLHEIGWAGCFIEGDDARFGDLVREYGASDRTTLIRAFVNATGERRLDALLEKEGITDLDLLSIDIDSDDLAIWRSVQNYRPTVVIIEYNPTIPFDTRYENPPGRNVGNAALSIMEHADVVGYDLVAGTHTNLVFVRSDVRPSSVPIVSLQAIKDHDGGAFRYFFGYDGTLVRESGNRVRETELFQVPWSRAFATQPVPRVLRRFDRFDTAKRILSVLTAIVTRPIGSLRMLGAIRRDRRSESS